jgi:hypothetical protein
MAGASADGFSQRGILERSKSTARLPSFVSISAMAEGYALVIRFTGSIVVIYYSRQMWKRFYSLATKLFAIPLFRLYLKLQLYVFKRALRLRQLLALKLERQIRLAIPEASLEGDDDEIDGLVHLAKLRLTFPKLFDAERYKVLLDGQTEEQKKTDESLRDEYESKKVKVDEIVEHIRNDKTAKDTIQNHWLVQHFIETFKPKPNPQVAEHYLRLARTLRPETKPLSTKDLTALRKETKKGIAELRELISDRKAFKISLSVTDITSLLTIISPFFLFTGYLYNHFMLGEFGIEVSKYFRLTDYISSSIEGIRYSVVGAATGVLSLFLGLHSWSRKSGIERKYQKGSRDHLFYFVFIVSVAGMAIGYVKNLETFYSATSSTIVIVFFYFAPKIARKFFNEPLKIHFLILFIGYFSAYMFFSIGTDTYKYKNYDFSRLTTHDVKFNDSYPIKETPLILLAGNSDYFFFLDRQRKALIVPRAEVILLRPNPL